MSFIAIRLTANRLVNVTDAAIDKFAQRVPARDRCADEPLTRDIIANYLADDSVGAIVILDEAGDIYGGLLLRDGGGVLQRARGSGIAQASWQGPLDGRTAEALAVAEPLLVAAGFTALEGYVGNARVRDHMLQNPKITKPEATSARLVYTLDGGALVGDAPPPSPEQHARLQAFGIEVSNG